MIHLLLSAEGGVGAIAQETAETFGISWDLFIPQVISFCIVAFLLQKFAYKPILTVLEERRTKIAESLANAEKIKSELADAEKQRESILRKANDDAQKLIDEARTATNAFTEKKQQEAVAQAEQIITKAREATVIERDKTFQELKSEIGRLVVDTTSKVTGKVLTGDDQQRLNEEVAREVAA